jgi:hypothetical protein
MTRPEKSRHLAPVAAPHTAAEELLPKLPFFAKVKDGGYFVGLTQVAIGIAYSLYILITQAKYFGFSLKGSWDNLDQVMHLGAIPWGIGKFIVANYDIGRHLFGRDIIETLVTYALVVLVLVKFKPLKEKTPFIDRVLCFLRMPSPYQHRYKTLWTRKPRHAETSGLQYLFWVPSMLLMAIPGEIVFSAIVFGGMAFAHHQGYHAGWLTPTAVWVPIVIGIGAGAFWGHRPAVKPGLDIQLPRLRRRLGIDYAAEAMLDSYAEGVLNPSAPGALTRDEARDQLTSMPSAQPAVWYPEAYKWRFRRLLELRAPAAQGSKWRQALIIVIEVISVVLIAYGLYAKYWGIKHGLWIP